MTPIDYAEKRQHRREEQAAAGPDPYLWLVTFSDLLMLILTMFVMRLSMLTLDLGEIKATVPSQHVNQPQQPAAQPSPGAAPPPDAAPQQPKDAAEAAKMNAMTQSFYQIFGQQAPVAVTQAEGRFGSEMAIRYQDGVLTAALLDGSFAAPGDELTFHASEAIATIVKTFGNGAFDLHISAWSKLNADTEFFGSDNELSSARALAVLRQMIDTGVDAQCLKVSSYGGSPAGALTKSANENRVEIEILARKQ